MDSITQIALGAAVGEAVVGKKGAWRGAAWGAVLGTLPDLDILANPFLDSVGQLAFHRSITHSILFAVLIAPLIGALLARLHRARGVPPRRWMWAVFWIIGTHFLLDSFTVYGTQVFWPFSDYGVSFNSLFIIDPLYTLSVGGGVVIALLLRPGSVARLRANRSGLILSTLYIAWSLVAKGIATDALRSGFEDDGVRVERMMTNPMPLGTVLWMGIAESDDTLHVALYSLLDEVRPRVSVRVPKQSDLVEPFSQERAVHRLLRFSKGWYAARETLTDELVVDDLRFGRGDAWLTADGEPTFRFVLEPGDCSDRWCSFRQQLPEIRSIGPLWERTKGISRD